MVTFLFLTDFDLNSYLTLLIAAIISTREVGLGTSQEPIN